jgi:phosphatidylglycerol:prolipoprotein diacylglycerol transferase
MIPFLHLGPLPIPTYGLMVAIGLLVAAYLLQFDINRRRAQFIERGYLKDADKKSQGDEAFLIIIIIGVSGLVGARLYSVLENPRELIANPAVLVSRYGFTWSGSVLTTLVAMVFLARHFDIPVLEFMDLCAAPAALGYAIGRLGCLLSGDGDYGVPTNLPWGMSFPNGLVPTTGIWDPESHSGVCLKYGLPENCTVHPTPIYEFLAGVVIAAFLWHMATKAAAGTGSHGEIISANLIWTGIARFLVEFIRINPKVFYGLTNAQVVSLLSIVAGVALLWSIRSRLPAGKDGNRLAGRVG